MAGAGGYGEGKKKKAGMATECVKIVVVNHYIVVIVNPDFVEWEGIWHSGTGGDVTEVNRVTAEQEREQRRGRAATAAELRARTASECSKRDAKGDGVKEDAKRQGEASGGLREKEKGKGKLKAKGGQVVHKGGGAERKAGKAGVEMEAKSKKDTRPARKRFKEQPGRGRGVAMFLWSIATAMMAARGWQRHQWELWRPEVQGRSASEGNRKVQLKPAQQLTSGQKLEMEMKQYHDKLAAKEHQRHEGLRDEERPQEFKANGMESKHSYRARLDREVSAWHGKAKRKEAKQKDRHRLRDQGKSKDEQEQAD